MFKLDDKWAPVLLNSPETGMGYHIVTIRLKNGERYDRIAVTGGLIARVAGSSVVPFTNDDIEEVVVTHDKSTGRD
jgi:hypothetical protein